jgi:hypothetical protein
MVASLSAVDMDQHHQQNNIDNQRESLEDSHLEQSCPISTPTPSLNQQQQQSNHPRLMSSSSSSTTHTNATTKSLLNHKTSNSSQATSYLQNIPGINMILPANDPSVRTIKQHYYPEGGWGWVIVSLASFVHFLTAGISSPAMSLLILEIMNTFAPESGLVAAGKINLFSLVFCFYRVLMHSFLIK